MEPIQEIKPQGMEPIQEIKPIQEIEPITPEIVPDNTPQSKLNSENFPNSSLSELSDNSTKLAISKSDNRAKIATSFFDNGTQVVTSILSFITESQKSKVRCKEIELEGEKARLNHEARMFAISETADIMRQRLQQIDEYLKKLWDETTNELVYSRKKSDILSEERKFCFEQIRKIASKEHLTESELEKLKIWKDCWDKCLDSMDKLDEKRTDLLLKGFDTSPKFEQSRSLPSQGYETLPPESTPEVEDF